MPSDFSRVRPDHPRSLKDGKQAKYEQPRGLPIQAYFPPGTGKQSILADPKVNLGFTEGEKKALAVDQSGLPCIGLTGVWNFQKRRTQDGEGKKSGPRLLLDDLQTIVWPKRIVWICFDTDPRRNPSVNQAKAELACVLSELGVIVVMVDLPAGPRGGDGQPGKMGIDDFIVAHGEEAFRQLVHQAIQNATVRPATRNLADYRNELVVARLESVGVPGVYLDRSQTGTGKSTADIPALRRAETSLTVLPTHNLCEEIEGKYQKAGLDAIAYPPLCAKTCQNWALPKRR
jgi:hypothetical protein